MNASLWQLAGWTMIHSLWLGAAVALAGGFLRLACRRAAPNTRYAISLATLAALAVTPFATAAWLSVNGVPLDPSPRYSGERLGEGQNPLSITPQTSAKVENPSPNPSLPGRGTEGTPGRMPGLTGQVIDLANPNSSPRYSGERLDEGQNLSSATPQTSATVENPSPTPSLPGRGIASPLPTSHQSLVTSNLLNLLPTLWLIGAPLTFTLLATGLLGSARLRRRATPLAAGPAFDACERLRHTLNITRRVALAVSDGVAQPILVGVLRPLILLPTAALAGWTPEQLDMVLLHELAHVRRWDNLVNLVQRIVESLLFFHPAVWLLSRQVRRDREECCDAAVIAHTDRPHQYAELLVSIAAALRGGPAPSLAVASAMASHPLAGRIRRILNLEEEPMRITRRTLAATLLLPLLLAGAIFYSGASAQDPPPSQGGARGGIPDVAKSETSSSDDEPEADAPLIRKVYPIPRGTLIDPIELAKAMHRHRIEITWLEDQRGIVVSAPDEVHQRVAPLLLKQGSQTADSNRGPSEPTTENKFPQYKQLRELFTPTDANPAYAKKYRVPPGVRKLVEDMFDGLESDPYGPQISFQRVWSDDERTVEVTAPMDAQAQYLDFIFGALSLESHVRQGENDHNSEAKATQAANAQDKALTLQNEIRNLEALIAKTQSQLIDLEVFKKISAQSGPVNSELEAAIAKELDRDPTINSNKSQLFELQSALQAKLTESKNSNSPEIRQLRATIQKTEAELEKHSNEAARALREKLAKMPNETLRAAMTEYKIRRKSVEENLAKYEQDLAAANAKLSQLKQSPNDAAPQPAPLLDRLEQLRLAFDQQRPLFFKQPDEQLQKVRYDGANLPDVVDDHWHYLVKGIGNEPGKSPIWFNWSRLGGKKYEIEVPAAAHEKFFRPMFDGTLPTVGEGSPGSPNQGGAATGSGANDAQPSTMASPNSIAPVPRPSPAADPRGNASQSDLRAVLAETKHSLERQLAELKKGARTADGVEEQSAAAKALEQKILEWEVMNRARKASESLLPNGPDFPNQEGAATGNDANDAPPTSNAAPRSGEGALIAAPLPDEATALSSEIARLESQVTQSMKEIAQLTVFDQLARIVGNPRPHFGHVIRDVSQLDPAVETAIKQLDDVNEKLRSMASGATPLDDHKVRQLQRQRQEATEQLNTAREQFVKEQIAVLSHLSDDELRKMSTERRRRLDEASKELATYQLDLKLAMLIAGGHGSPIQGGVATGSNDNAQTPVKAPPSSAKPASDVQPISVMQAPTSQKTSVFGGTVTTAYLKVKFGRLPGAFSGPPGAFTNADVRLTPQEIAIQAQNCIDIVKSPSVLKAALAALTPRETVDMKPADAVEWLRNRLSATFPGDGEIFELRLDGGDAKEDSVLLQAVIDAFIAAMNMPPESPAAPSAAPDAATDSPGNLSRYVDPAADSSSDPQLLTTAPSSPKSQPLAVGDVVLVQVTGALPDQTIDDAYNVDDLGTIALGPTYGRVPVVGLSILEAEKAIQEKLQTVLQNPLVQVSRLSKPEAATQSTGEPTFLYDGKTFDQWRDLWKLELNPERRIEAVSAMAAFSRAGYGDEAINAILDVAAEYDFALIGGDAEGKLKERIIKLFTDYVGQGPPKDPWLPIVLDRMKADPDKWRSLVEMLLYYCMPPHRMQHNGPPIMSAENIEILKKAVGDERLDADTLFLMTLNKVASHDPDVVRMTKEALQSDDVEGSLNLLRFIGFSNVDELPEQLEFLFAADLEARQAARDVLARSSGPQVRDAVADKLLAILNDPNQSARHADAIRALAMVSSSVVPTPHGHHISQGKRREIIDSLYRVAREGATELFVPAVAASHLFLIDPDIQPDLESSLPGERVKLLEESKQQIEDEKQSLLKGTAPGEQRGGGFF